MTTHSYRSFPQMFQEIMKQKGISGFYEGGTAVVMRDAISMGFFFSTYEVTKRELRSALPNSFWSEVASVLSAGALAGTIFRYRDDAGVAHKVSCYPFDLVKTAMIMEGNEITYQKALEKLVNEAGWKGILRGWAKTISWKVMPSSAIGLLVYELTISRDQQL